jgi:integrase
MPTIIKRESGYQCRVRIAGHPPESQVFDTKARAAAWGHAREAALRDQARGIVRATLQDAIDKYITDVCPTHRSGDNEIKRLKALAKAPKLLPVAKLLPDVTPQDLAKFRDTRLEQVSVATVRKEMGLLRSVLESARRDWGMVASNPLADVKRPSAPPHRDRLFVGDEVQRICTALGYVSGVKVETLQHQVAVALLLALETAMRAGEMLGLTWARVHLQAQYVSLPETKNGDRRDVPLSTRAVELLTSLQGLDAEHVFTITSASLDALFRKARDKCTVKGLHFHDSRATALTNLSKKLDVLELARMVGHRDVKSLMIYYRPTATTLAKKLG